jgi:hypothetical protein
MSYSRRHPQLLLVCALLDQFAAGPYGGDFPQEVVIAMAFGTDERAEAAIGLLTAMASTLRALSSGAVS